MGQLGDQGVQILDDQQPVQRAVTHPTASHSARAIVSAGARASSAIASASSHSNQRASGLSSGGGCGSSAPAEQEVAQVEVGMTEGRLMDVEVDQAGPPAGMRHLEPELLDGLAQGGLGWLLAGVDVPAGLHPAGEALVQVQDRAPGAHDDGRGRDVGGVGVLVVGIGEAVQLGQEAVLGGGLPRRGGPVLGHESPNRHGRGGHGRQT